MQTPTLANPAFLGTLRIEGDSQLPGGTRYCASAAGDGMEFVVERGSLPGAKWLTCDLLLEGNQLAVFLIELAEGEDGPRAGMQFGALNGCQARIRIPLSFVDMNRWMYEREGAWLKPLANGRHVSLANADRIRFTLMRIGTAPVDFSITPLRLTVDEPPRVENPLLPKGPLIDELGQSTLHDWPAKSRSTGEVTARLKQQLAESLSLQFPPTFSRWGGWSAGPRVTATGFFRTHFEQTDTGPLGGRWWLVDPDGHLFWSAGQDCVGPRIESNIAGLEKALTWLPGADSDYAEAMHFRGTSGHFSYSVANFIRAFGAAQWRAAWAQIVLSQLRGWGFNTMANWSDWHIARAAGFPYVRPLAEHFPTTPNVFRDFPDVYHENFARDCAAYAGQLEETLGDRAMIGYFLMNEPTWGFATETPAQGMLYNTPHCESRKALAGFLGQKYGSNENLAAAWDCAATLAEIEAGTWSKPLSKVALNDLAAFSTIMVDRLYRGMTDACRRVDPNHMNLGARYYAVPPAWCLDGMTCFDVFSLNAYTERIPAEKYNQIAAKLNRPVLAGEWHFGALDVGLAASGIGHVDTQAERGKAYRIYLEDAATCPACVGVHHFQMYDQSALGRFDGENYNIGFVDVAGRPYTELTSAALAAHARMYIVRDCQTAPYNDVPEYLARLFI